MTAVEIADRKARFRAYGFLFLSALSVVLMAFNMTEQGTDFTHGLWVGVLTGCALNLLPIYRWLRPNSAVFRLMDDETARQYRQLSCTVGFGASTFAAIVLAVATRPNGGLTPAEVAEIIATASIATAVATFALLELRAGQ